ncbi:MAG TPA: formylglycine-generating enzyme family protein [candidate division Zixibacteria bacterium]|nr:formylglycine-generating enzyme family protein [candidate division Zixibacteria bacterium]
MMHVIPRLFFAVLLVLAISSCSVVEELAAEVTAGIKKSPGEPASEASREPALGDSLTRPDDGMVMVYVPEGEFMMGSDEDEVEFALALCQAYDTNCSLRYFSIEQPQHELQLSSFWLDKTEVSNSQYQQCLEAGYCEEISCQDANDMIGEDQPAVCVTWNQAVSYCQWAGARLPTEAQWEYSARGLDGRRYPWGSEVDGQRLNYCDANCELDKRNDDVDDGYARTAPVGSYPDGASWVGALDMSGNVWEWTADWYGPYTPEQQANPTGPETGDRRVLRGGSWHTSADHARSALRTYSDPNRSLNHVGFRCALSVFPSDLSP